MFPDDSIHSGWHSLDEEVVPVRVSAPQAAAPQAQAPVAPAPVRQTVTRTEVPHVSPRGMQLSAFAGVAVVLVGLVFYFGIDSLRGSLLGDVASSGASVNITTDGHFSPSSVSVVAGSTLTITNQNADPQVIKIKSGPELFPTQVLFDKPYVFSVPSGANGTYVYFSETLPDSETLTVTVSAPIEQTTSSASSSTASSVAPTQDIGIPLPFGDAPGAPASSAPTITPVSVMSSSASSTPVTVTTTHGTQTITLDVAGQQTATSSSAAFIPTVLPTNPYTVGSTKGQPDDGIFQLQAVSDLVTAAPLHSGAPLAKLTTHRPRTVTTTGPDDLWLVLLPAFALMFVAYRKMAY